MDLDIDNLRHNVALAPFTTYKIGGPADLFVEVTSVAHFIQAITQARKASVPYFILGTGANILIGDKGFRGLVIRNCTKNIDVTGTLVRADSGVTIAELIDLTTKKGLSGLEHFAGIPSSVGGAVWQNLHFLSPDRKDTLYISEVLKSAAVLTTDGKAVEKTRDFFQFGYDDSILHHQEVIVLDVTFELQPKPSEAMIAVSGSNLAWRLAKQPQLSEYPSCGSVFKKIEGVGGGRLIEQAGLKGFSIGGAQISTKHANYIINTGGATATDVMGVIKKVQSEVLSKTGYKLTTEIGFIGEF